jgi:nucleoside-triphosphatase
MKLLVTGAPHVGKSTLLKKVVHVVENRHGFITNEVTEHGQRTGFELCSSLGDITLLASVNSASPIRVSRYGVQVDALNDFIARLPEPSDKDLIYIDEIGQMELFSGHFKELVRKYLDSSNPFLGTLTTVYEDEFTAELLARPDITVLRITEQNRDALAAEIIGEVAKYVH